MTPAPTDASPPDPDSSRMETLGARLKAAREAKGLSVPELAKITRIKMQQIDGLERDDFATIPAPAYGKGFVKLIAQVLEADGVSLAAQYQAQVDAQPAVPKARETPRASAPPKSRTRPGAAPFSAPVLEPAHPETTVVSVKKTGEASPEAGGDTLPIPSIPDTPSSPAVPSRRIRPAPASTSWRGLSPRDLLRRWPVKAAASLLLLGLLLLPWACRRGRQPAAFNAFDLGGADLPLLAEPDTPLFDLPVLSP